ncbi:MAG: sigma-70 family RNA polymerase sigma factor [Flavobacteriales bacterium]|jgi:RNA polymerase sigma-70 factor (ECF subfamily)|nr:sigma-70 family RNA polymerase sigma factor [Flavobacteriales bacterium]
MEDLTIITKIKHKDFDAFNQLIRKYENLVFSIILKVTNNKDDAKDIAQEVFLSVFNKIHTFRNESSLATWIGRIAYNLAINHVKKHKTEYNDTIVEHQLTTASPEETIIAQEKSDFIQAQIKRLPQKYRTVLLLYHKNNMSYKEISFITKTSESSVKTNIFRARKMLKEKLTMYLK